VPNQEIVDYIKKAHLRKIDDREIRETLLKSGWTPQEVDEGFQSEKSNEEVIILHKNAQPIRHFSLWIAFEYVLLFICMYVSFSSLAGILHEYVNRTFPDTLKATTTITSYYPDFTNILMKGYISGIIVTFPIFAGLFITLMKQEHDKPQIKDLKTRKVLIYLTLIITFIIMICQIMATAFGFLNGDPPQQVFFHFLVTIAIAGSIFGFLIWEVKEDRHIP
jgi:uncharacterized membrane protein